MNKANEILEKYGLDFHITKQPLVGFDGEGNQIITPYYGLFNDKTKECINTCKAGYTVSQNADVVEMVLRGTEKFGNQLNVTKAGSIHGGRRVFLQLEIEGNAKVGDDKIQQYITVIDSNDGSTSLSVGIGDEAAHCFNQFFKFYKVSENKFRHTATLEQKIASIPNLIQTALGESMRQVELYRKFLSTPLTKGLADKMIKEVLGYDRLATDLTNRQQDMADLLHSNINTEIGMVGNNVYGLFNGITRYTTHHQSAPKRENGKVESLMVGTAYNKALAGFEFCLDLV